MNDHEFLKSYIAEGDAPEEQSSDGVAIETPESVEDAQAKDDTKDESQKPTPFGKIVPSVPKINVPTGGVGLLLTVAVLMAFAIAKAPNQDVSRLVLIWKALIGQATLGDGSIDSSIPSLGSQWSPSTPDWTNPTPAVGNTGSGTWGNQWGGGFY